MFSCECQFDLLPVAADAELERLESILGDRIPRYGLLKMLTKVKDFLIYDEDKRILAAIYDRKFSPPLDAEYQNLFSGYLYDQFSIEINGKDGCQSHTPWLRAFRSPATMKSPSILLKFPSWRVFFASLASVWNPPCVEIRKIRSGPVGVCSGYATISSRTFLSYNQLGQLAACHAQAER